VGNGKYLTTDDLDECHGITSEITLDGKKTTIYHYVMTMDFPYSVSCFRGKPVSLQIIPRNGQGGMMQGQGNQIMQNGKSGMMGQGQSGQANGQPPQAAFTACSGKSTGATCSLTTPNGILSGTCQTPPSQTAVVCIPAR
jgi:hypothetical protein